MTCKNHNCQCGAIDGYPATARGMVGEAPCGAFLAGIGYGIAQPCIYDRTASVASAGSATYAMALVMTMNYVAIVICPPVVDYLQKLFAVKSAGFAFALDACIGLVAVVVLAVRNMNKRR